MHTEKWILRDLLPEDARVRTPKIINASESILDGSVCVENYHAILASRLVWSVPRQAEMSEELGYE